MPKTAEIVASRIRNAVIRGELTDGDMLPAEAQLMEEYKISRPTIREAIRILESEGLVVVSRGARGGSRVVKPDWHIVARSAGTTLQANGATIGDLYEARTIIEPPAARLIVEKNREAGVKALREHLEYEKSLVDDRAAVFRAVAEFHRIMLEASSNLTLTMFAQALHRLVETHLVLAERYEPEQDRETLDRRTRFGLRSHAKLIDLIEMGDGAGAEAHWRNHMLAAGQFWLAHVTPETPIDLIG